jgi:hypothetical protein
MKFLIRMLKIIGSRTSVVNSEVQNLKTWRRCSATVSTRRANMETEEQSPPKMTATDDQDKKTHVRLSILALIYRYRGVLFACFWARAVARGAIRSLTSSQVKRSQYG